MKHIGTIAQEVVRDAKFRRDVTTIHDAPTRVLYEMMLEIGRERNCLAYLEEVIARYAAIDPAALAATGGDQFPPRILHVVEAENAEELEQIIDGGTIP